jgi:hypothetical protein
MQIGEHSSYSTSGSYEVQLRLAIGNYTLSPSSLTPHPSSLFLRAIKVIIYLANSVNIDELMSQIELLNL